MQSIALQSEYCSAVEQKDEDTLNEVVHKLRQEIKGDEKRLLYEATPSLRRMVGDVSHEHQERVVHRKHSCDLCHHMEEEEEKTLEAFDGFSEGRSHRLKYLIKRVASTISSVGDPIVCLFDDIQVSIYLFSQ